MDVFQSMFGIVLSEPSIKMDETIGNNVNTATYIGNCPISKVNLGSQISCRIGKAGASMSRLEHVSEANEVKLRRQDRSAQSCCAVLISLTYSCESWTQNKGSM